VDNDKTLSHRYSPDGVTEVMERRASSPVPGKQSSVRKQSTPPSRRLSGGRPARLLAGKMPALHENTDSAPARNRFETLADATSVSAYCNLLIELFARLRLYPFKTFFECRD
jgi:hypothetical protein